jgi:hypothetical protein
MFSNSSGRTVARHVLWTCALVLGPLAGLQSAAGSEPGIQPWLLVDTEALTLSVMRGEQPAITLHNIAIGRYGATREKVRGDNNTPLGRFRVTAVRRNSGFHRFIALDYPDSERAHKAQRDGIISQRLLQNILAAHRRGNSPPQNTPLGGQIGIHGLGNADPGLHERINWTRGCIALTDYQVDSLLTWIEVGMTVEIR